jgi:DNA-directed RNA polymerase omega subunit
MMIDPPIDKMIEKTDCKYALVCLIAKRARAILDKRNEINNETSARAVADAAREVYEGIIEARAEK